MGMLPFVLLLVVAFVAILFPDFGILLDIYFHYLLMLVSGLGAISFINEARESLKDAGAVQKTWVLVACAAVFAVIFVFTNFDIPNALSTYR